MSEVELTDAVKLPLDWHIPEHMPCQYATNLVVQHTEHEFIISFFRASPPIVFGPREDAIERTRQMESVRAECVGRIVVAPGRMPEFVEVLQQNLERFNQSMSEE